MPVQCTHCALVGVQSKFNLTLLWLGYFGPFLSPWFFPLRSFCKLVWPCLTDFFPVTGLSEAFSHKWIQFVFVWMFKKYLCGILSSRDPCYPRLVCLTFRPMLASARCDYSDPTIANIRLKAKYLWFLDAILASLSFYPGQSVSQCIIFSVVIPSFAVFLVFLVSLFDCMN